MSRLESKNKVEKKSEFSKHTLDKLEGLTDELFSDISSAQRRDILRQSQYLQDTPHYNAELILATHAHALETRASYNAGEYTNELGVRIISSLSSHIGLHTDKVANFAGSRAKVVSGETFIQNMVSRLYTEAKDEDKELYDAHYSEIWGVTAREIASRVQQPGASRPNLVSRIIEKRTLAAPILGASVLGAVVMGATAVPAQAAEKVSLGTGDLTRAADISNIVSNTSNLLSFDSTGSKIETVSIPSDDNAVNSVGAVIQSFTPDTTPEVKTIDPVTPENDTEDINVLPPVDTSEPSNGVISADALSGDDGIISADQLSGDTAKPTIKKTPAKKPTTKKSPAKKEREAKVTTTEDAGRELQKSKDLVTRRLGEIIEGLASYDISDADIAALAGNFKGRENPSLNPSQKQHGGGPGFGIAQWTIGGRGTTMINLLGKEKANTLKGQAWFVHHELTGSYSSAYRHIKEADTIAAKTIAVSKYYEQPNPATAANDLRIASAKEIYAMIKDLKAGKSLASVTGLEGHTAKASSSEKEHITKVTGYSTKLSGDQKLTYYNQRLDSGTASYAGGSLRNYGCAPSSLATIVSTLTGNDTSNLTIARKLEQAGAVVNGSGTNRAIFDNPNFSVFRDLGIKVTRISNTDAAFKRTIDNGGMVLMRQQGGVFSNPGQGHFMVVTGYNNNHSSYDNTNHKYLIADPNGYKGNGYTADQDGFSFSTLKGANRARTGNLTSAWAVTVVGGKEAPKSSSKAKQTTTTAKRSTKKSTKTATPKTTTPQSKPASTEPKSVTIGSSDDSPYISADMFGGNSGDVKSVQIGSGDTASDSSESSQTPTTNEQNNDQTDDQPIITTPEQDAGGPTVITPEQDTDGPTVITPEQSDDGPTVLTPEQDSTPSDDAPQTLNDGDTVTVRSSGYSDSVVNDMPSLTKAQQKALKYNTKYMK